MCDIDAETVKKDRYLQIFNDTDGTSDMAESNLPFLRWLISNVALKNDSILIGLSNYVRRMMVVTVGNIMFFLEEEWMILFMNHWKNREITGFRRVS